ncbi:probable serine/threonine-protein kinase DDB_G0275165 [Xenia sp. Carnegie-2017]|uniref:probable serine/threonine-protein kinase DDB_G0275165 n=1 Tax=Xenia sp. Carnegie-2017 TaxID=2897299 RepID=UPI001F04E7D3|nr:probable serine/threonine-protein kinase DDB_G0275165 [Xenia sp. Carnegie-2017]
MAAELRRKFRNRAKRLEISNLRNMVFNDSSMLSDVEKRDKRYLTALHKAAKLGLDDCVEELLKKGANPNRQSSLGTAMHLAAAKGHVKCLELLTTYGGFLQMRDKKGETALQLAEKLNQEDVIQYIAHHPAQNSMQIKNSPSTDNIEIFADIYHGRENLKKAVSENMKLLIDRPREEECSDTDLNDSSTVITVPIPEIFPDDLEIHENYKYAVGPKTLSIMGKLNGRIVTVKTYHERLPDKEILQLFYNELETIRCLFHPNIALLLAICVAPRAIEQNLLFEPVEYHFLHRILLEEKIKLQEDAILKIAHDVANAMQYVHNMGFLHCYLGCQSVIVTRDYTAKICNFEYSLREDKGPVPLSHCTLLHNWMAPEQILGFPMDKTGDVFSFGVLLWECLMLKRSRQLFSLKQLSVIGKSVHYKLLDTLEGMKNVKVAISDCTKISSMRPSFYQIFAWLDGLLHYRLVNVAPVTMDAELQAPPLFNLTRNNKPQN